MKRIETLVLTAPEEHAALGCFLEIFRRYHRLSQTELGVRVGLPQSYLSRYENGSTAISPERIEKLLSGFGLEAKQLGEAIERACASARALNAKHRGVPDSAEWYSEGVLRLGPEAMQGLLTFFCWQEYVLLYPDEKVTP